MKLVFSDQAWEDYLNWQSTNKQIVKRIHLLIKDIQRHPYEGIGKPEPLKHFLSGCWSRHIDEKNRLVYRVEGDAIEFLMMASHYGDR